MRLRIHLAGLSVCAVVSGCLPDLGPCDPDAARAVVWDEQGVPAFEGQALLHASCGRGVYCHSGIAEGSARFGAPRVLDFDVATLDVRLPSLDGEEERLRVGVARVREHRHRIYGSTESGDMPPFGDATELAHENVPRYFRADGRRLPWIDSREGIAIVRNWLSCDAPFVERNEGESRLGGDVIEAP